MDMSSLVFAVWFDRPIALALLACIPLVIVLARRSLSLGLGPRQTLAVAVRCLVLATLVLALAGPSWMQHSDAQTVVVAIDHSLSVPGELQDESTRVLARAAATRRAEDRLAVLSFAGRPSIEQPPAKTLLDLPTRSADERSQTDLESALRTAVSLMPPGTSKRVVLVTDGNQTRGDALREAAQAAAAGVRVDVVPLRYQGRQDVLAERLAVPQQVRVGEMIDIRLTLTSNVATTGQLAVFAEQDGRRWQLDLPSAYAQIELNAGRNLIPQPGQPPIRLRAEEGGPVRLEALFIGDAKADIVTQNNRVSAYVDVASRGRVLWIHANTDQAVEDASLLASAVVSDQIRVTPVPAGVRAVSLAMLSGFDAVVLDNVPESAFSAQEEQALATFVRDAGGGLAMLGGDDSFGAGGWQHSPLAEVLPVDLDARSRRELLRSALVLAIDRSGSMQMPVAGTGQTKLALAVEAAIGSAKMLSRLDHVGVIAFDSAAEWVVPLGPNDNPDQLAKQMRRVPGGGGTDMKPALAAARQALASLDDDFATRHVILLTDGEDVSGLANLAEAQALAGQQIALTPIAIGDQTNLALLQALAAATGQRAHLVRDPQQLPAVVTKQTRLMHRPYIVETPFVARVANVAAATINGLLGAGDALPPLEGYVVTEARPLAEVALVRPGENDPVLASWQIGLGRTLAFTSGMWQRWGPHWPQWSRFAAFWSQSVRWLMRQRPEAGMFDVRVDASAGRTQVWITGMDADGSYFEADRLSIEARLVAPDGKSEFADLQPTGPGTFEAILPTEKEGDYVLVTQYRVMHADGRPRAAGVFNTPISVPVGSEFRSTRSDDRLLEQLAERGAGQAIELATLGDHDFFARNLPPVVTAVPIWWPLLLAAMGLFLLNVAVTKVQLDALGLGRRLAPQPSAAGAEQLEALRRRRDALRQPSVAVTPAESSPLAKPAVAPAAARAAASLPAAGSSPAAGPRESVADQVTPSQQPDDEPVADGIAGRLQAAKRRAKKRFESGE